MSRRPGLIDHAVDALRDGIVSGEWPVGSRMPTEPALSKMLGVSRNTVREAVQALVHSGLVERRQGSGTYVVGTSELAVTISREVAAASQSDVVEVRHALEVEAARLAAVRCTTNDVAEINRARDARQTAYTGGDLAEMVATDLALHRAVVRASGNPLLAHLYENLIAAIGDDIQGIFVTDTDADAGVHDALVAAVVTGDPEAAARETTSYLATLLD
ncbi:MAG: FadR family transcriptional regulator [Micrococcales bacterium]|nr:FadR family transcriptional regulator [Micrococcales bacterium]